MVHQGHLIAFSAISLVEHPAEEKAVHQFVALYNPNTRCWDCVGSIDYPYNLGISVHIRENKILFIRGSTSTHYVSKSDDVVRRKACQIVCSTLDHC